MVVRYHHNVYLRKRRAEEAISGEVNGKKLRRLKHKGQSYLRQGNLLQVNKNE